MGSNREVITLESMDMLESDSSRSEDGFLCPVCKVVFATMREMVGHLDESCSAPDTPARGCPTFLFKTERE